MFIFASRLALAIVLATLALGGTAHAQTAPVPYWSPGWPVGFGGTLPPEQGSDAYGDFQSFDGNGARGTRYNFPNGMFVGSTSSAVGLNWSGLNQTGAFGNFGSLRYEGTQFGYNFGSAGGLPVTIYGGVDTLKYDSGIGGPFAPFDSKSGTLPGYRANVGIEFKPTTNLSLSLGVGYVQQPSGNIDSEINSLPGASPLIPSGRR